MSKLKMMVVVTLLCITCTLAACGRETFTCAICGKTVTEIPHKETILGREVKICDSCYEGLRALQDLIN